MYTTGVHVMCTTGVQHYFELTLAVGTPNFLPPLPYPV